MTTIPTIPGAFSFHELGQPDNVETRLIKLYRQSRDTIGRQERPFTIVVRVDGDQVELYSGNPQGRLTDEV